MLLTAGARISYFVLSSLKADSLKFGEDFVILVLRRKLHSAHEIVFQELLVYSVEFCLHLRVFHGYLIIPLIDLALNKEIEGLLRGLSVVLSLKCHYGVKPVLYQHVIILPGILELISKRASLIL